MRPGDFFLVNIPGPLCSLDRPESTAMTENALLLWLHAEAVWQRDELDRQKTAWWERAGHQRDAYSALLRGMARRATDRLHRYEVEVREHDKCKDELDATNEWLRDQ